MSFAYFYKRASSKRLLSVCALIVLSLGALSGCAKKSKKTSTAANPAPTTQAPPPRETEVGTDVQRYCPPSTHKLFISTIESVAAARLAEFFQVPVSGLENDASACFRIVGYGTFLTNAAVRVEFEDHYGVSALEFNQSSNVFYAEVKQTNSVTSFEAIFMDSAGFLQVKGSGSTSATLTFRFHNFPSVEDHILNSLTEIQTKCKNGTYTVAQCLGYNWPPTFWWNQPIQVGTPRQQMLELARSILNDNTKSKTLGTSVRNITSIIFR